MGICRALGYIALVALLVAAPAGAATEGLEAFILGHNGTPDDAARLCSGASALDTCLATPSHLLCVKVRSIPNSHGNSATQQAALKIQAVQVKHRLYGYCLAFIKNTGLLNNSATLDTYLEGANGDMPNLTLKGLETMSRADGDTITVAAAVPHKRSIHDMERNIRTKPFTDRYCAHLFPTAKQDYLAGKYEEALVILKEVHDLAWADAEAYILAAHAFLKTGKAEDALKISGEVLSLLTSQLTPELAEHLGDIFLELGRDREAEQAFTIALDQLTTK